MLSAYAWARTAAVLSVIYAGVNVYALWAGFEEVREKARQFSEISGGGAGAAQLRVVRALFYLGAPVIYLGTLLGAGLPVALLAIGAAKFWISSTLGLSVERKLLRGGEYGSRDHLWNRLDAAANIAFAAVAVLLILRRWI